MLDDVELMELPDTQFLIDSIVQHAGVGAVYSPSGAGKTTLLAGMQVALAARPDWFGHRVMKPCASVYVAAEDPSGYKMRLRAAKRAAKLPLEQPIGVYTFPEPIDLRDPVSVIRFSRFLKQIEWPIPLGCIVVDTYAASTPGAKRTAARMRPPRWSTRNAGGMTSA